MRIQRQKRELNLEDLKMDASKPESKARRNPAPYEVYRHFKGNSYQILTLAKDSGDGHAVVVYQGLYEPYEVYTRKLSEFMSEVDKWKYPKAKQKYRFEKVSEDRWHEQESKEAENAVSGVNGNTETDTKTDMACREMSVSESDNTISTGQGAAAVGQIPSAAAVASDTQTVSANAAVPAAPASSAAKTVPDPQPADDGAGEGEGSLDPAVLEFLEARTNEERLNVLTGVKHRITDEMLNTMAICADIELNPGPVEERYRSLKNCLMTKEKFERLRLR